jgi:hypothetical protein
MKNAALQSPCLQYRLAVVGLVVDATTFFSDETVTQNPFISRSWATHQTGSLFETAFLTHSGRVSQVSSQGQVSSVVWMSFILLNRHHLPWKPEFMSD